MQERVYETPVRDTSDFFKQQLIDTWASVSQKTLSAKLLINAGAPPLEMGAWLLTRKKTVVLTYQIWSF